MKEEKPKKKGRPCKEPKPHRLTIYMTDELYEVLLEWCTYKGQSMTEFVCRSLEEKFGVQPLPPTRKLTPKPQPQKPVLPPLPEGVDKEDE